jgi:predicted neuraminidase
MFSMMLAAMFAIGANAQESAYKGELIFPLNPQHNHGSSIVETPSGDLLACWFHGTGERTADDVLIQGARKRKGSDEWSEPFLMADTKDLPDCNPVLFIDSRGTLWLFWIAVQNNEWGGSLLKYRTATEYAQDGPPVWKWQDVIHCRPTNLEPKFLAAVGEAEKILEPLLKYDEKLKKEVEDAKVKAKDKLSQRLGWMTRLHPIMVSENRLMLGLYSDVFNCSLAAFTSDWGETWEFSEPIIDPNLGNIQPSFIKKRDGGVVAMMRDNGMPHRIRIADSTDGGMTWSPLRGSEIRNPGSSVECISLRDGNWVLVCNDTVDGRHLLTAYISEDEGASWKWKRALESFDKDKGSFSYPSVIQAADDSIHCTYSYSTEGVPGSSIKHATFTEQWVRDGGSVDDSKK